MPCSVMVIDTVPASAAAAAGIRAQPRSSERVSFFMSDLWFGRETDFGLPSWFRQEGNFLASRVAGAAIGRFPKEGRRSGRLPGCCAMRAREQQHAADESGRSDGHDRPVERRLV